MEKSLITFPRSPGSVRNCTSYFKVLRYWLVQIFGGDGGAALANKERNSDRQIPSLLLTQGQKRNSQDSPSPVIVAGRNMCRQIPRKFGSRPALQAFDAGDNKATYWKWSPWMISFTALICYGNSLLCGLVFDDQPAIRDNMDLRPTTPISNLLYNDFWGTPMHREESHKSYRPLCVLTFRINYWLHELHPLGYHLVNILLHIIVCLLYHRLCCDIMPYTASFIAAVLFTVHPIHTEAVTGVVGRAELLSSILFLLALRTYIRSVRQKGSNDYKALLQCLILAALAMFSKEQGVTVVAICITYDILLVQQISPFPLFPERARRGKIKGPTPTWRKDLVLRLLVMISGTLVILATRMKLMGTKLPVFNKFDNPAAASPWPTRQLTYNYLVPVNIWLLIYPSDLCCDWTMGTIPLVEKFCDVRVAAIFFVYVVIACIAWKGYCAEIRISRRILMGLCLCVFPFVPASNLLYPVGFVVAERVLYIPSMGFCLLVAHGWHTLYVSANTKQKYFLHTCLVILLCLNTTKTICRNMDWRSEVTLFRSGLRVTNQNAKLYNNLGHVLEADGKHQEALNLFLEAAEIQPDDLGSYLNVGRIYNTLGRTEDAEKAFWMAKNLLPKVRPGESYQTHIVPRHLDLFLDLGNLLSKNDSRLEEAQELYREAISMKTDYIDAYMQRASVLLKLNRSEEAHDMYREALKYDHMNPDIFYNMGVLLLEQGKSVQALARFDQALQLDPEHEKSLLNYAILTQDSGDSSLRRLAHERLQVLVAKGRQPERTHFNLGMLAMRDGDRAGAERHFRKALQLRSDFDPALFNLALVLYERGRPLEAVPYLRRLNDRHVKGLVLLGNIYFNHLNDYTAAQRCYELILQSDPNHVPALHNLCAAYFQTGRLDDAETCLQKAVSIAPNERYIQHHLSLVRQHRNKLVTQSKSNVDYCFGSSCNTHAKDKTDELKRADDIVRS